MFVSFDSSCHYSTTTDYTMFRQYDSLQEDLSSMFSPFSSDDQEGLSILQQQEELLLTQLAQQQLLTDTTVVPSDDVIAVSNTDNKSDQALNNGNKSTAASNKRSNKRSGKKDRHSKIATAQGIRDRRMRLSLEVAPRFFTLQDMLGFDKASKTVEWLLTKSKSAIKELGKGFYQRKHSCFNGGLNKSEYEVVVSEIYEGQSVMGYSKGKCFEERKKSTSSSYGKPTLHPLLAKESRAKARERARERTFEKMRSRGLEKTKEDNQQQANHHLQSLGPLNPFEPRGNNSSKESALEVVVSDSTDQEPISHCQVHQGPIDQDIVNDSFLIAGNSSPSSSTFINNHDHNAAISNFRDNWGIDMAIANSTSGSMTKTDVQFYDKPWDLYDNQIDEP